MLRVVMTGAIYLIIALLFLIGYMGGQAWFAFPIFSLAFVLVHFVRRKSRESEENNWRIYIPAALFIWAMAGVSWLPSFSASNELHVPELGDLSKTTGRLKKSGGKRYILLSDGSTLRIICADHYGKGADNWCLYAREAPYMDKIVTVYHAPPVKISTMSAAYYELQAGKTVVVDYDDVARHIRDRAPQLKESSNLLAVFLTVYALYSTVDLWFRRRRFREPTVVPLV